MKRLFSVFFIVFVFFCFASCGSAKNLTSAPVTPQPAFSSEQIFASESHSSDLSIQSAAVESPSFDSPPASLINPAPSVNPEQISTIQGTELQPANASSGCIAEGGGYSIEILSAKKDKDYTGADVVVVTFKFTNNSPAENTFSHIANVRVIQDGKGLEGDGVVMDQSTFDGLAYNFTKEVKVGQSLKCVYAYFTSSNDPVDISVEIYDDFMNRKVLGSASCILNVG